MRICFFIQNHLGPNPIARLIHRLQQDQPNSIVLVGHDPFAGHATADLRKAIGVPVLEAVVPARRGYLSLIQPYFQAIEWLAAERIEYDWIVYLSAQDYPTQPLRKLEKLLATTVYDGFLRYQETVGPTSDPSIRRARVRYRYQYHDVPAWLVPPLRLFRWTHSVQKKVHLHFVYGPRVGVYRTPAPWDGGRKCYMGTQWTILRRRCAEYVLERVHAEVALMKWFERTVCPDEAVVQTLLLGSGRFHLCNNDLRYIDHSGSRGGRPRTLTVDDLPTIVNGSYYFARKFDAQHDARVLDLLDQYLELPPA